MPVPGGVPTHGGQGGDEAQPGLGGPGILCSVGVSPAQTPLAELQHPGIDSGTTRGARQSTVSSGSGLKG